MSCAHELNNLMTYVNEAVLSENPQHALKKLFLHVEEEAYNRALSDVEGSIQANNNCEISLDQIRGLRLSKISFP